MPDTVTQERVATEQAEGTLGEPVEAPQDGSAGDPVEEAAAGALEEPTGGSAEESVAGEAVNAAGEGQAPATETRTTEAFRPSVGRGDEEGAGHPIEFLSSIEVEAVAELGRAEVTIGEVLGLRAGSVVQLNKMLGEPAELMVKDRLVARGEVVVVEDRFGLRITEVVARGEE
jgi:flagellar motor switch protein FliN/FliY